jgi:hypothetical protein
MKLMIFLMSDKNREKRKKQMEVMLKRMMIKMEAMKLEKKRKE